MPVVFFDGECTEHMIVKCTVAENVGWYQDTVIFVWIDFWIHVDFQLCLIIFKRQLHIQCVIRLPIWYPMNDGCKGFFLRIIFNLSPKEVVFENQRRKSRFCFMTQIKMERFTLSFKEPFFMIALNVTENVLSWARPIAIFAFCGFFATKFLMLIISLDKISAVWESETK